MSKLQFKGINVKGLFLEGTNEHETGYPYVKCMDLRTKCVGDGYHTFKDLYHHRMILTLALALAYPESVTKAKLHADGTMFDNSFIVCFQTPEGDYSYHYDLEYWDLFKDVKTVDHAPVYDGHKPEDVERLLSIKEAA